MPKATWASGLLVAGAVFSSRLGLANPLFLASLLLVLWAFRRGELSGKRWIWPLLGPTALFCGASLLSALFSLDPTTSFRQLPRLLVFLLIPLAANLMDERAWRLLAWGLAGMTGVLSLWGLWQYSHGYNSLTLRIRGPLSHYMTYAGWLLLAFCVLLALALLSHWRGRFFFFVPAGLALVALFLSYTRNVWVGLGVGVMVLAACWRRRLLLLYPLLALAVLLVFPESVRDRLWSMLDLRQPANFDRLCMVYSGVQMVRDYPLTGVGLDMVPKLYPLYRRDDAPRYRVPHLHNNLLQIAAERGLVTLAAYLWLLAAFFSQAWRHLPQLSGVPRAAVAAALSAVAAISTAGLFEYNFWDAEIQYLTFVLMGGAYAHGEAQG
ncbi:MAG: O-antigen ligase family protein [Thermoanaerobaculum sp.]